MANILKTLEPVTTRENDLSELALEIKKRFSNIRLARTHQGFTIDPLEVLDKAENFTQRICDLIEAGELKYLIFPQIGAEVPKFRILEKLKSRGFDISKLVMIDAVKHGDSFDYSVDLNIIGEEFNKAAIIDDVFDTGRTGDTIANDISLSLSGVSIENFYLPFHGMSYKILLNPDYTKTEPKFKENSTLFIENEWVLGSNGMDSGDVTKLEFLSVEQKAECIAFERLTYIVLVRANIKQSAIGNINEYNFYRDLLSKYCIVEGSIEEIRNSSIFQTIYNLELQKLMEQ